jgi:predicted nucleic-acid-binding Zn-ribbon protein
LTRTEGIVQTQSLQAGKWYHTVECSRCGAAVHAFHARSGDGERLPGPGLFSVRCDRCGYPDLYKPSAFKTRRFTNERLVAVG